jgi:hypothetical protein
MFNLIVSTGVQSETSGTILAGRVFEHTDKRLVAQFKPGGQLDTAAVMSLPTVFMEEGTTDEIAGVGWLSRVEPQGSDYQLRFALDSSVPRLTNRAIRAMASELRIDDWEFTRNHWAVKDVDLFHTLYKKKVEERPVPRVFPLSQKPVNPKLISIMMPFEAGATETYRTVKAAVEAAGYECRRADDFWLHQHIMHDILELISTSQVIICDLSGKNANVFYEAGIAHTLGKEVILVTQHDGDVPFDLRSLRYISYLNNGEGRQDLAAKIVDRLRTVA